ncbi:MAG: hypothetical protein QXR63_05600 [Candidatus Bathyarchaeia archaeon]
MPKIRKVFALTMFLMAYLFWGFVPFFEKLCKEEVGPMAIVIIRFGVSTILLLILLIVYRIFKKDFWMKNGGIMKFSFEKVKFGIIQKKLEMPRIMFYSFLGILFIVALDFFFFMIRAFGNALAVGLVLSLGLPAPLTALFEVVFGKFKSQKISNIWRFAVGVVAAISGVGAAICRLQQPVIEGMTSWTGYIWVFGFVIAWSAWLIIKTRETQLYVNKESFIIEVWKLCTIFSSGLAFNFILICFISKEELQGIIGYFTFIAQYSSGSTNLSYDTFLSLSMMSLLSTFLAYLALFKAFAQLSDSEILSVLAVVLQTFEPLTALLIEVFVWRRGLTNLTILGIILVLASMTAILIISCILEKQNLSDRQ